MICFYTMGQSPQMATIRIRREQRGHPLSIRLAIKQALQNSVPGDTILVAGKGHEDYQEIMGVKHPFDDRQVIRDFK